MLRHKATIQAIRVAFGIGGIHDEDEAKDVAAGGTRNVTPTQVRQSIVDPTQLPKDKSSEQIEVETVEAVIEDPTPEAEPKKETPAINLVEFTIVDTVKNADIYTITITTGAKTIDAKTSDESIGGLAEFNKGQSASGGLQQTSKGVKLTSLVIS